MAAFLIPFSSLLGIDVRYRGGYSFGNNSQHEVRNDIEMHQWLEVTFRPSMETTICDLWYEGVNDDMQFLHLPMDIAYS